MKENITIFFVDDDRDDLEFISNAFKKQVKALDYAFFGNGNELLLSLNSIARLPELIILDINMPLLDGTQTLAILKGTERFVKIPVVILSTSESPKNKEQCNSLKCTLYLIKPWNVQDYEEIVTRILAAI